jgi:hypothetical protein
VWYLIVRRPIRLPRSVLVLTPGTGPTVLLLYLSVACTIQIFIQARWFDLSPGVFSLIRASGLALGVLATAGLAHELGARSLSPGVRYAFYAFIAIYSVVQTVSLYLSAPFMTMLVGAIAFSSTRRRLPLAWVSVVCAAMFFLQPGKSEMRNWVWHHEGGITPLEYPEFFGRWIEASLARTPLLNDMPVTRHRTKDSGIERASIIHMLMLVQQKSPDPKPFLHGETYAVIPYLLVPRILDPDKPRALEGQYILCIYYGLQTRAQALKTGIAFGLPAEAYANFGYTGVTILALILGCAHGLVTRYCFALPVLSLRSLFALIFIGLSLRNEASGAVVITTLVQATLVLFAGTWFIMTPWRLARPAAQAVPIPGPGRPFAQAPRTGVPT